MWRSGLLEGRSKIRHEGGFGVDILCEDSAASVGDNGVEAFVCFIFELNLVGIFWGRVYPYLLLRWFECIDE